MQEIIKTEKFCKLCEVKKVVSSENFAKAPANKDGFKTTCKSCDAARRAMDRENSAKRTKGDHKVVGYNGDMEIYIL